MKIPEVPAESTYNEMFPEGVKTGRPTRPVGIAMFPTTGDKNIDGEAKRRAMAVIRHLYQDEIREVYMREARYLGGSFRSDFIMEPEAITDLAARLSRETRIRTRDED